MEQFASPKRRSSADRQLLSNPTDKVIQFFSSVFSRNNTNSTTTTTNGLSERKRVVISGIPAGIGNTGPGTQVKQRKVPIKVDPKVYFANERTFLAWLHISVILSSASIAIMALAKENSWSVMYGIILLPVAVSFLVYAMVQCESSPLFIYFLFIYFLFIYLFIYFLFIFAMHSIQTLCLYLDLIAFAVHSRNVTSHHITSHFQCLSNKDMRRAAMIRRRDPGPYEAIVGPTILTIMLMISIVMQFTVKLYSIEAY